MSPAGRRQAFKIRRPSKSIYPQTKEGKRRRYHGGADYRCHGMPVTDSANHTDPRLLEDTTGQFTSSSFVDPKTGKAWWETRLCGPGCRFALPRATPDQIVFFVGDVISTSVPRLCLCERVMQPSCRHPPQYARQDQTRHGRRHGKWELVEHMDGPIRIDTLCHLPFPQPWVVGATRHRAFRGGMDSIPATALPNKLCARRSC